MPHTKLSKKQLDYFKKRLQKIKEEILHDIRNMDQVNDANAKENSGDVSGHAQHMADVATDMYDREFTLGLASNDRELLNKVESALKRIQEGTYGICLKSKKTIPLARLKAIPYAEFCVEAQEELERGGRV